MKKKKHGEKKIEGKSGQVKPGHQQAGGRGGTISQGEDNEQPARSCA